MWLPPACALVGSWPATQACALNGNRTSDPLVCGPAFNPLSHTSQGWEKGSDVGVPTPGASSKAKREAEKGEAGSQGRPSGEGL